MISATPASAEPTPDILVDTSAAVPLVVAAHRAHDIVTDALDGRLLGLSGHAWFESFSVLTRLPPPARLSGSQVSVVLTETFPGSRFLPEDAGASLAGGIAALGVAGGSVYDALVAAAAVHHDLPLATRDSRAVPLYRELGVQTELVMSVEEDGSATETPS